MREFRASPSIGEPVRSFASALLLAATLFSVTPRVHSQPTTTTADVHTNSEEGLTALMQTCLNEAQQLDNHALISTIASTEIPNYPAWFRSNYPGPAESWIIPYGHNLKSRESQLKATFYFLATQQGTFTIRKLIEDPDHPHSMESAMLHGAAGSLSIYKVTWTQSITDKPLTLVLGFFYFIDGGFRWDSNSITAFNQPIKLLQAIYPYPASDTQHIGQVMLRFHIEPDGKISPNEIVALNAPNMSTDPKLVQAATQALLKSQYLPPAMFETSPDGTQTTVIYVSPLPPPKHTGPARIIILPKD